MAFGLGSISSGLGGAWNSQLGRKLPGLSIGHSLWDDPEQFKSRSFSDVDLATENPQLWAELQKYQGLANQAQMLYDQRRQGPSELEKSQLAGQSLAMQGRLANQGLLGTSAGFSSQGQADWMNQQALNQQIQDQQNALLQNALAAEGSYAGMLGNAQNAIVNGSNQAQMTNLGINQANNASRNQFYSGLINGGLSMVGGAQGAGMLAQKQGQMQNQSWQPGGSNYQFTEAGAPQSGVVQYTGVPSSNYGYSGYNGMQYRGY